MDKRKIRVKNVLHKELYSSQMTSRKEDGPEVIPRSVSDGGNWLSRKRTNSEDPDSDVDESTLKMSRNVTKRRCNKLLDDDDDDSVGGKSNKSTVRETTPPRDASVTPSKRIKALRNLSKISSNCEDSPIVSRSRHDASDLDDDLDELNNSNFQSVFALLSQSSALNKSSSQQSTNAKKNKTSGSNTRPTLGLRNQMSTPKTITNRNNRGDISTNLTKVQDNDPKKQRNNRNIVNSTRANISDDEIEMSFADASPIKQINTNLSPLKNANKNVKKIITHHPLDFDISPTKLLRNSTRQPNKDPNRRPSNNLISFFEEAGITLSFEEEQPHFATEVPSVIRNKMRNSLDSGEYNKTEIIEEWQNYIENRTNLIKCLNDLRLNVDNAICNAKATTLARIILQVIPLQTEVIKLFFEKLIEGLTDTNLEDNKHWTRLLLLQFRFLEVIVDPECIIVHLEKVLQVSSLEFQKEVILFLPDIVIDAQHHSTAEMLSKIMVTSPRLTTAILECLNNLTLGKEYTEEMRERVSHILNGNLDKSKIPAITKFILSDCPTLEVALKSLKALRSVDMVPLSNERVEDCYNNQLLMINEIKMNILISKEVAQAATSIIKDVNESGKAVPLDIILLMLLYVTTPTRKKIAETALTNHIRSGFYKPDLLQVLYNDYKEVAKMLQPTAVAISSNLLKADDRPHVEFAIAWFRYLFGSQADATYKQREIMEKILLLMGNKGQTAKDALNILSLMSRSDKERKYLERHSNYLRILLEKMDNFELIEVSILYDLLHGLCNNSQSIANALHDDLSMLMQKQLSNAKFLTKSKGVLGAAMAMKHLAGKRETAEEAATTFKRVLISVKDCPRSESLFYDNLGDVIKNTKDLDVDFLVGITDFLENKLEKTCLVFENVDKDNLEPKFGLNEEKDLSATLFYVSFGNEKAGACIAQSLFRLLRICHLRTSNSLESISAVLGNPVLMPADLDNPEPLSLNYMINCINWFRELISGFVMQDNPLLQGQVLRRLESLMKLQGEFCKMLPMCDRRYQPPPCYFQYFPVPQFVRLEKNAPRTKKGKKNAGDDKINNTAVMNKTAVPLGWESWERGSEISTKNPAFFRQLDSNVVHLLDVKMNLKVSQASSQSISIPEVCFIVKEILHMLEKEPSEKFMRELVHLLPTICGKLKSIISDIEETKEEQSREAVRLLLRLLTTIFSWKEFRNDRYAALLRDGLRSLASMANESNKQLRSCKDLVSESYKYFHSLSEIATRISLAVALVNLCQVLMNHSNSFSQECKKEQSELAHGLLCLEWLEDGVGSQYKAAVKELLKCWIENAEDKLKVVTEVLEWVTPEVELLQRPQSRLSRLSAVTKMLFPVFFKQIFDGLLKGTEASLKEATRDPERVRIWKETVECLALIVEICKVQKNNMNLIIFVRYMTLFYQMFLVTGMPVLEVNFKYHIEDIIYIIKMCQKPGKFLRDIFCTARKYSNVALLKLIPVAKMRRERFIYRVKGMLTLNNSINAFWMGSLVNKDLDGEKCSQESENTTVEEVSVPEPSIDESTSHVYENNSDIDDEENEEVGEENEEDGEENEEDDEEVSE